jgi:predicted DCC family thiol-disulfide oxidoreductase YuxK
VRLKERVVRAYLTSDPRSLALGRIALALVLLADLLYRTTVLRDFYSNEGLLPNHTLLWRPQGPGAFSFFFMASTPFEAALGFVACGLAYLALLVGYRTRLAQVASFLCVISLHARVFQNGGDFVLSQLCLWTMFLPTGRRYSVDSLRARLRAHPERTAAELEDRSRFEPDTRPVVSLAVAALIFQLVCIYALNATQKSGVAWRDGTAVHYVLHQDTIVTRLGVWVRGWITPSLSWWLTRGTIVMEGALPLLLLSPVGLRTTRRLAIALAFALHIGFVLLLDLEMFTPAMIAFLPNLIPGEDLDAVERWQRRRARGATRTVLFDGGSGVCFLFVRALARLDRAGRFAFAPLGAPGEAADLVASRRVPPATMIVVDGAGARVWAGAWALAEIARGVPGARPLAWLIALPGARQLADVLLRAIARRRSAWPAAAGPEAAGAGTADPPAALRPGRAGQRGEAWSSLAVAGLVFLATSQLLVSNPLLSTRIPLRRPAWVERLVSYLQIFQTWSMFAPDVKTTDFNVSVDAITADGRHVDPFNEAANPEHPFPGTSIPAHLDQNAFFVDWALHVPWIPDYHQAFQEWILRYPERTGRAQDAIVSFQAFVVEDDSPPPGERQPRNARASLFFHYP